MPREQPDEPTPSAALIRPYFVAGTADDGREPVGPSERTGELRPFLMTSGRTTAARRIPMEMQVVTTAYGRASARDLVAERRDVVELCFEPMSVAEIGARTALQLGVVRVLVADLADEGRLSVFAPEIPVAADVDTLARVIKGLRAIR